MSELMLLNYKLLSLAVFQNILKDDALKALMAVFAYSENSLSEAMVHYSKFLKILYESEFEGDFSKYLYDLVLYDNNLFSISCAKEEKLNENILNAVKNELEILNELIKISTEKIKTTLALKFQGSNEIVETLGYFENSQLEFNFEIMAEFYKNNCYGIFAKHSAFSFDKSQNLKPAKSIDDITLNDLKNYTTQKKKLVDNTLALLSGKCANNILLYGDRGCGKSSSVKAIYNEYKNQGLKIVQILKADLVVIDKLMEQLAQIPSKFIIFIDDLTFSSEDENLSALKSMLEGGISKQPQNTVIYATTNRRHIIKETFSSREGNEVHLADTIDENASLSDRFGITLTFLAPNKDIFLNIAQEIALDSGVEIDDKFYQQAERFALLKSSRSPRVAQQFVKALAATL